MHDSPLQRNSGCARWLTARLTSVCRKQTLADQRRCTDRCIALRRPPSTCEYREASARSFMIMWLESWRSPSAWISIVNVMRARYCKRRGRIRRRDLRSRVLWLSRAASSRHSTDRRRHPHVLFLPIPCSHRHAARRQAVSQYARMLHLGAIRCMTWISQLRAVSIGQCMQCATHLKGIPAE
jgi:hypothetical protein